MLQRFVKSYKEAPKGISGLEIYCLQSSVLVARWLKSLKAFARTGVFTDEGLN